MTETPDRMEALEADVGIARELAADLLRERRALEAEVARLRETLNRQPEETPEPIGRVRRKWWRLGWLSAMAVARAALSPAAPSNLDYESEWYRKGWEAGRAAAVTPEALHRAMVGQAEQAGVRVIRPAAPERPTTAQDGP